MYHFKTEPWEYFECTNSIFYKCRNGYLHDEIKVDRALRHTQESSPGDLEYKSKIKSLEHKIREHIYDTEKRYNSKKHYK